MDLTGWTPMYSYFAGDRLMLDWCHTRRQRFTEAFFGDTIDRLNVDLATLLFRHQTTMEQAGEWNRQHPGMPPNGFIFHMSRCGSTLVSQMLAAAPANRSLSEPTPLNAILRAALLDAGIPRATLVDWLRTAVSLLGDPLEGETRYFIKLECWHVLALPLIVEAFPDIPWIFLYRNPAEVLVSQARACGAWTVPSALDPEIFGVGRESVFQMHRHEYQARALAKICEAAWQNRGCGHGMLVNYEQLPEFVCDTLPRHFGVTFSPAELEVMRSASLADAKNPYMRFSDDRHTKRQSMTPAMQLLVKFWLTPWFDRLITAG
jgi:hypothetical protein